MSSPLSAARAPDGHPWPRLIVGCDTREQLPYGFASPLVRDLLGGPFATEIVTLATGDYAPIGPDGQPIDAIRVERKSLGDYVGSVTARREAFVREMQRMGAHRSPVVIVEAPVECLLGSASYMAVALLEALDTIATLAPHTGTSAMLVHAHRVHVRLRSILAGFKAEQSHPRWSVSPRSLLGSTLTLVVDYRVPVLFLPSREWAEFATAWCLQRAWRRWLFEDGARLAECRRLAECEKAMNGEGVRA